MISCDFEKVIDMPDAEAAPKLAVTAILDTDSGRFTLSIFEALPLSHYKDWQPISRTVIRDGKIRLFENDNLILQLDGPFDLSSNRQYSENPDANEFYLSGYHYKKTGISAVAEKTYRLEAEIDGYEMITATTIMPDAPIIGEVKTDMANIVRKTNAISFNSLEKGYSSWLAGSDTYIATDVSLTDNSTSLNYYAIQQMIFSEAESTEEEYLPWYYNPTGITSTGVSNPLLIQDNPDYESQMGGIFGESESYDLYLFDLLLISDFTFANGSTNLKLHARYDDFFGYGTYPAALPDYNPENDGVEIIYSKRFDIIIKHISSEAYKHYKSLALQLTGMDFFTEPVNIVSNVENGYGCFSACNSTVISMEYEVYYYPEKQIYYEY